MPNDQSAIEAIDTEPNPQVNSSTDLETLEKGLDALETGPRQRRSVKGAIGRALSPLIAIAVILMAVAGRLAFVGVGPFKGDLVTVAASGDGLAVTLMVTNQGTSAGATTCVLNDPVARYGGANG